MGKTIETPIDRAARILGGRPLMAEILGVSIAAIGNWKVRGVPFEKCMPIERATGGQVTRGDLRPADYFIHWPDLAPAQEPQVQAAINFIVDKAPKATAYERPDRRRHNHPPHPDQERREPLAVALAQSGGV